MHAKVDGWLSHRATIREVQLEGQTFLHLHCIRCDRDFVKQSDLAEWKATHIGIFRFNLLDASTNERWTSEQCPGMPLKADSNDKRRGGWAAPNPNVAFVRHPKRMS
jgi:hypothetical protein